MSDARSRGLRVTLSISALLLLSACAVPISATIISLAAGGLSYATTGKSLTDNYLSYFTDADCAVHRIMVDNTPICIIQPEATLAEATDLGQPIYLAGGADDTVIFSDQ